MLVGQKFKGSMYDHAICRDVTLKLRLPYVFHKHLLLSFDVVINPFALGVLRIL